MLHRLLTNSCMGEWQQCPRKYLYRYELGFVQVYTPEALSFGTAMHACLEAYWRARKARAADPLAAGLAAMPGDLDAFEAAKLRVMVRRYARRWDRIRCRVLAVEAGFEVPLRDPVTGVPSVFWKRAGKIDLVLQDTGGAIVLVEHKGSSEEVGSGSDYNRRLFLDSQLPTYKEGALSLGYEISRIVYDVLRKPQQRPLLATPEADRKYTKVTKKNPVSRLHKGQRDHAETPAEYEARLESIADIDPEDLVNLTVVHRFGHEMNAFADDVWDQAEMMRAAVQTKRYPRYSKNCFRFGKACAYLGVCEGRESIDNPLAFTRLADVHPELERAPGVGEG